jgi:alkanesulfonate monooxygenase SsuD/methylene tetrahydromethanopterin reductase-like flavin-dependent oxidoreductase (luciferase family)
MLAVQDHPYQPAQLDALALLGMILAQTDNIRVFQDVGNLPLRPPAAFAKAAATRESGTEAGAPDRDLARCRQAARARADRASAFTMRAPAPARDTDKSIVGPPGHWAAVLAHLALDFGFGTFVLLGPPGPDLLRTFIERVAPEVRERVAAGRAQAEPVAVTAAESSQ